ncbi:MAG: hypothetical protein ACR2QA_06415 [Solirubrobacteraceae bacterium]
MRESKPPIHLGSGLAGFVLVLVILWALAAVLMLTGTLTNARQINRRVKLVNAQVDPIDKNLRFVKLAATTAKVSGEIKARAMPLTGEAAQIVTLVGSINSKGTSILNRAHSINGLVNTINGSVRVINGTVHTINRTANTINGTVQSINSNVNSIGGNVQSVSGSVASVGAHVATVQRNVITVQGAVGPQASGGTSINADVRRIFTRLGTIRSTAESIKGTHGNPSAPGRGVFGINDRAEEVIGLSRLLKGDLNTVQTNVGTMVGGGTVLGHANSIDCSTVVNLLGPTTDCQGGVTNAGAIPGLLTTLLTNPIVSPIAKLLGL